MKACKRCYDQAEFILENSFYCKKCVSRVSCASVPIKIVSGADDWKRIWIKNKASKRLNKISHLIQKLSKKTAKLLAKVQEMHLAATTKLNQKYLSLLELINSEDLDSVYQQLNNKFFCGFLKKSPKTEEICSFYNQEFFAEEEKNEFGHVSNDLDKKKKLLEKKFSLFVDEFKPPALFLTGFQDSSQLILTDGQDSIRFFSLGKKSQEHCIRNSQPLKYLQVFGFDRRLAAISNTGNLLIWDTAEYKLIHEFKLTDSEILACIGTPENIYYSTKDMKLLIFSFMTLQSSVILEHSSEIIILALSHLQYNLVCACSNKEVFIVNTLTKENKIIVKTAVTLTALESAKQTDLIVLALANKVIQVWTTQQPSLLASIPGHLDFITSITITPDDSQIITCSHDKKFRIFNTQSRKVEYCSTPMTNQISSIFLSPDSKYLFIAAGDIKVFSFLEKKIISFRLSNSHSNTVNCVEFDKKFKKVATGSKDKNIKIWKIAKKKVLKTLTGHTDEIAELIWTENEVLLVSVSIDKTVRIWNVDQGEQVSVCNLTSKVVKVYIDKLNEILIVLTEDKLIRVFTVASGKLLNQFSVNPIMACKFQVINEGQQILVACEDKSIKVLSMLEKKLEKTLTSHQSSIISIHTTPFNYLFASCSSDGVINLWSKSTFQLLNTLKTIHSPVQIILTKDDKFISIKSQDNSLQIFDLQHLCEFTTIKTFKKSFWSKRYPYLAY